MDERRSELPSCRAARLDGRHRGRIEYRDPVDVPWWRASRWCTQRRRQGDADVVDLCGPSALGPSCSEYGDNVGIGDERGATLDDEIEVRRGHAQRAARITIDVAGPCGMRDRSRTRTLRPSRCRSHEGCHRHRSSPASRCAVPAHRRRAPGPGICRGAPAPWSSRSTGCRTGRRGSVLPYLVRRRPNAELIGGSSLAIRSWT